MRFTPLFQAATTTCFIASSQKHCESCVFHVFRSLHSSVNSAVHSRSPVHNTETPYARPPATRRARDVDTQSFVTTKGVDKIGAFEFSLIDERFCQRVDGASTVSKQLIAKINYLHYRVKMLYFKIFYWRKKDLLLLWSTTDSQRRRRRIHEQKQLLNQNFETFLISMMLQPFRCRLRCVHVILFVTNLPYTYIISTSWNICPIISRFNRLLLFHVPIK